MNSTADTPLQLFFDQLRDIYSMEVQLCESMPQLASLCTHQELRKLIVSHTHQNCDQIAEIAAIFERHGQSPGNEKCKAMAGLIEGGTDHLQGVHCPNTRDLMMVAHCRRIEYYEMAAYEFTTLLSGRLGLLREPAILSDLLAEEKDMSAALMLLEPDLFETANSHA
jgi:ferritin-like metal-binding protein YciE